MSLNNILCASIMVFSLHLDACQKCVENLNRNIYLFSQSEKYLQEGIDLGYEKETDLIHLQGVIEGLEIAKSLVKEIH